MTGSYKHDLSAYAMLWQALASNIFYFKMISKSTFLKRKNCFQNSIHKNTSTHEYTGILICAIALKR